MNQSVLLTIASLLSILFFTFHLTDDIVRGIEKGGWSNLAAVPMVVVWLYGALVLAGRRAGYIILLLGSVLGMLVLMVHTRGSGLVGGRIANSSGMFFWVFTLLSLGITSLFSLILSVRGLWSLRRRLT